METLKEIWTRLKEQGHETDKGSVHSYLPVYEKLLAPYRETALNVLEIGIFNGASIRMWAEYFTKANIYGIDCSITPHGGMANLEPLVREATLNRFRKNNKFEYNEALARVDIYILDAENQEDVSKCFKDIKFDVIIEDANHSLEQQVILSAIWWDYLNEGGVYVIEDVQDIKNIVGIKNGEIIDLRQVKGRYDDIMIILRK